MKLLRLLTLVLLTSFTSCSYYAYHLQTGSTKLAETDFETIKIYSGDIEQDYIVIGSVTSDTPGKADKAIQHLKKNASKLGANAIIKVKLTKINSFSNRTGLSGVAVRLK